MVKPSVFVDQHWAAPTKQLFMSYGYPIVETPEVCDIVVFNGGEDLHPKLYNEAIIPQADVTWLDEARDVAEVELYNKTKTKFKFGICRGGQLLNVMNGGRLWQHVDKHQRAHDMIDTITGETIFTSSVHHQQFILGKEAVVLAQASLSHVKMGNYRGRELVWARGHGSMAFDVDPEVVWYPKDRALCIQGHPEYGGYEAFTDWCFNKLEILYNG